MSKSDSEIVRLAGRHVFELFSNASADVPLIYHGFKRSRGLVDDCREIAKGNKLDGAEGDVLLLSAWFHDAGYAARKDGGRAKHRACPGLPRQPGSAAEPCGRRRVLLDVRRARGRPRRTRGRRPARRFARVSLSECDTS